MPFKSTEPVNTRKWGETGLSEILAEMPENSIMAEIGCYAGASTVIWLKSPKVKYLYAVDLWENFYSKISRPAFVCDMEIVERKFDEVTFPYRHRLEKYKKSSVEAAECFENDLFDMVYIDADHAFSSVKADILAWMPKVKAGGLLAGHDYFTKDCGRGIDAGLGRKPDAVFTDSSWLYRMPRGGVDLSYQP